MVAEKVRKKKVSFLFRGHFQKNGLLWQNSMGKRKEKRSAKIRPPLKKEGRPDFGSENPACSPKSDPPQEKGRKKYYSVIPPHDNKSSLHIYPSPMLYVPRLYELATINFLDFFAIKTTLFTRLKGANLKYFRITSELHKQIATMFKHMRYHLKLTESHYWIFFFFTKPGFFPPFFPNTLPFSASPP